MEKFKYAAFKASIRFEAIDTTDDTTNLFDAPLFIPGVDSVDVLLSQIDALWREDVAVIEKNDSSPAAQKAYTAEEKKSIIENVKMLDSFLVNKAASPSKVCREKECVLYAEIVKSKQELYLYLDGEIIDTFKVSTGIKKYETPTLNLSPSGPMFQKYTSKKFPGGNYEGLGNMPYAVFLRGGYAIHGTTVGNFAFLGRKASHGCIRLHPHDAKLFYELVKVVGLQNTWVRILN